MRSQPELEHLLCALSFEGFDKSQPAHAYLCEREQNTLERFCQLLAGHCAEPASTARQIYTPASGLEQQWLRAEGSFSLLDEWNRAIARILPE